MKSVRDALSLRRHYPDQVHRVEDNQSSSQPVIARLPVLTITSIVSREVFVNDLHIAPHSGVAMRR